MQLNAEPIIKRKRRQGVIDGLSQDTAIVVVSSVKMLKKYGKRLERHKRYKVFNPKNQYEMGDIVVIEECRPLSRNKCWQVVGRVS